MNLVVILICFLTSLGITEGISSVEVCSYILDNVALTCNSSEMIHVESITYYNGFNCTQAFEDKILSFPPVTNLYLGLRPHCNGQNTDCVQSIFPRSPAARLDYRCIKDTEVYNMCEDFNKDNINNNFFLSTPNFPQFSPLNASAPCICSISGTNITSIKILDLQLRTASNVTWSNLLIDYGDNIYNKTSLETSIRNWFVNDYLTTTDLTSFTVQLNHNINNVSLWMEIKGGTMVLTCSSDGTTISLTPTPTTTTSRPDTTTARTTLPPPTPETTSDPTTTSPVVPTSTPRQITTSPSTATDKQSDSSSTILILTVLLSLSLLVIVGIFLVILILCRRRKLLLVKQSGHLNGVGREVTRESGRVGGRQDGRNVTTESDRNIYNQLNHSASEPVRDEPYQELRVMNSTPEYDNIQNPNYLTVIA